MRTITVPLLLINLNEDGFHLLVEIGVFGKKHYAVVDTGASRSVFDKNYIEVNSNEFTSAEDTCATTLFTTSAAIQAILPKLRIGKLTLKNYPAVALDLQSVNEAYSQMGHPKIIAILGGDILYQYQAKINYKKLKLFFSQKHK